MKAYYNEHDPFAAQWLRNLIAAGLIMPGHVDERSIVDVRPSDLDGFTRCHFFAGIGVWDYALTLAGWPADRPVWTGSCPCQPFSAAGKRGGVSDERHLWPAFFHLIEQCRPAVVLGEQVASKDGLDWLDLVQADLEGAHYDIGAVDLCAAGAGVAWEDAGEDEWLQRAILDCPDPLLAVELRDYAGWARTALRVGPPHIRQRLWFVADAAEARQRWGQDARADRRDPSPLQGGGQGVAGLREPERGGATRGLAHPNGRDASPERQQRGGQYRLVTADGGFGRGPLADMLGTGLEGRHARTLGDECPTAERGSASRVRPRADWIACRDGAARPVEPGTFPLGHGLASRVGRLRAYGNALNAEAAAAFIAASMDALGLTPTEPHP